MPSDEAYGHINLRIGGPSSSQLMKRLTQFGGRTRRISAASKPDTIDIFYLVPISSIPQKERNLSATSHDNSKGPRTAVGLQWRWDGVLLNVSHVSQAYTGQ